MYIQRNISKYKSGKEYTSVLVCHKFNAEKYELDYRLCGKYVLNSNVAKDKMKKEEVRQAYKNLQNVEHAIIDLSFVQRYNIFLMLLCCKSKNY